LSSIPTPQEFIGIMQPGTSDSSFRMGTVVSGKIQFDGEDEPSQKTYKRLASYTFTNGDRVLLAKVSGTYVILGKIV
jgi:co-chaperonin GroES (HSP10)